MMGRLAAKDSYEKRPFKPQIYKSRGQSRSYNQTGYQNRGGRSDSRSRGQYGNNRPRQNYIETITFEETPEGMEDKIIEKNTEIIDAMNITEVEIGQEKGHFQEAIMDRSSSNSRSRSGSRASTNRDRIRCYNCREYDHFVRDCPNSKEEKDLVQPQQMLNLEAEEQTHLLTSRQDSPTQYYRSPLNL